MAASCPCCCPAGCPRTWSRTLKPLESGGWSPQGGGFRRARGRTGSWRLVSGFRTVGPQRVRKHPHSAKARLFEAPAAKANINIGPQLPIEPFRKHWNQLRIRIFAQPPFQRHSNAHGAKQLSLVDFVSGRRYIPIGGCHDFYHSTSKAFPSARGPLQTWLLIRAGSARNQGTEMSWTWLDLLLYTVSVYGLAWLVTQSKLFERPRNAVKKTPFIGDLVQCVVCTGTWIGAGLALLLPCASLFSPGFRMQTPIDLIVLLGWVMASTWGMARLLGDAD
jgi:hypothetical protein